MLKKIGLFFLVALLLVVGAIFYFYFQATSLPTWYDTQKNTSISKTISSADLVTRQIRNRIRSKKNIKINEEQMSALIISKVKPLLPVNPEKIIKGLNVSITEKHLAVEAVINLKNIPKNKLPGPIRHIFNQVVKNMPDKLLEESLIQIQGKPLISNGFLSIDDSFSVNIGGVPVPVRSVLKQLGKGRISDKINLAKIPYTQIQLKAEGLELSR